MFVMFYAYEHVITMGFLHILTFIGWDTGPFGREFDLHWLISMVVIMERSITFIGWDITAFTMAMYPLNYTGKAIVKPL